MLSFALAQFFVSRVHLPVTSIVIWLHLLFDNNTNNNNIDLWLSQSFAVGFHTFLAYTIISMIRSVCVFIMLSARSSLLAQTIFNRSLKDLFLNDPFLRFWLGAGSLLMYCFQFIREAQNVYLSTQLCETDFWRRLMFIICCATLFHCTCYRSLSFGRFSTCFFFSLSPPVVIVFEQKENTSPKRFSDATIVLVHRTLVFVSQLGRSFWVVRLRLLFKFFCLCHTTDQRSGEIFSREMWMPVSRRLRSTHSNLQFLSKWTSILATDKDRSNHQILFVKGTIRKIT